MIIDLLRKSEKELLRVELQDRVPPSLFVFKELYVEVQQSLCLEVPGKATHIEDSKLVDGLEHPDCREWESCRLRSK